MVARLSASEARRLQLPQGPAGRQPAKTRQRKVAKGAYHTACISCGVEFNTRAAEDRHLDETHHARYELVLGYGTETHHDRHDQPPAGHALADAPTAP